MARRRTRRLNPWWTSILLTLDVPRVVARRRPEARQAHFSAEFFKIRLMNDF